MCGPTSWWGWYHLRRTQSPPQTTGTANRQPVCVALWSGAPPWRRIDFLSWDQRRELCKWLIVQVGWTVQGQLSLSVWTLQERSYSGKLRSSQKLLIINDLSASWPNIKIFIYAVYIYILYIFLFTILSPLCKKLQKICFFLCASHHLSAAPPTDHRKNCTSLYLYNCEPEWRRYD